MLNQIFREGKTMETGKISDDYHYKIVRLQRENVELKKQLSEANSRIGDLMACEQTALAKVAVLEDNNKERNIIVNGQFDSFRQQLTTAREIANTLTQLLYAGNTQRAKELAEKLCEVLGEQP